MLLHDGALFVTRKGAPLEAPDALAPLADTHGHLTSFRKTDPSVAVARAALAGVRLLAVPVDPADDVASAREFLRWFDEVVDGAAALLDDLDREGVRPPALPKGWEDTRDLVENVHMLAGVHPYGAKALMEDPVVEERLVALLSSGRCVGVGEFGLDFGPWNKLPSEVQVRAFRKQLRMAHECGLPVELHLRDADGDKTAQAHTDALMVLREEGVPEAGCDLHCYTSGPEVMAPFVELGCRIAFGGALTFARSTDIREAAARCPSCLMLSETDSPYMTPVPLRGQECEPAMVAFTVARMAEVREEAGVGDARDTYEALWRNATAFLGVS